MVTENESPLEMGQSDFKQCREKHTGYFVIVKCSVACRVWVAPGSRIHVFYSDEKKDKLCVIIKMAEVRLVKGACSLDTRTYSLRMVDGEGITGCTIIHLILGDVYLKEAVALVYDCSMHRNVQNKQKILFA